MLNVDLYSKIQANADCLTIKRWLPEYLEDILFKHIHNLLDATGAADHNSCANDTLPMPRSNSKQYQFGERDNCAEILAAIQ